MPFILATEQRAPAIGNSVVTTLQALGASHHWPLSETTGDFVDVIGNWDLTPDTDNVHRGIIGPVRGAPRQFSFAQGINASRTSGSVPYASRLLGTVGAIGGFIGVNTATTNTEQRMLLQAQYDDDVNARWALWIGMDGSVHMLLRSNDAAIGFYAEWVWSAAAIKNAWKTNAGDTYVSGDKLNWICVVQRADGTGPKLSLNGATPVTFDSSTYGVTGGADSWMAALDASLAFTPTTYVVQTKGNAHWFASPFVFDGVSLSDSDIARLYNAAEVDGDVTDYAEYVYALDPDFWKPPTNGNQTNTLERSWWNKNIGDISAWRNTNPLQHAERWLGANDNVSPWPISDLPGMRYRMDGVQSDTTGFDLRAVVSADNEFSDEWTAANGFDVGTVGVVFEMPPVHTGTRFVLSCRTVTPTGAFDISTTADFLRILIQKSTGNQIRIELDRPFAPGTLIFAVYRGTGSQIDTFVNGVLRDGGDIGTTITGTGAGSDWIHVLRDLSRWELALGCQGRATTTGRLGTPVYDAWMTRQVLTNQQIADMWDLLKENKLAVTAP